MIISANNVSYSYSAGQHSVDVLRNINFTVDAGEMIAIQGPSGSGKSTLLYLLGCVLRCQQGEIVIDGVNIANLNKDQLALIRNQKIGFVFQQFYLLPKTTVLDNILLPTIYPIETANFSLAAKDQAISLATRLGLAERLAHYPNELSGGEQQRVAIARALIRGAKIILADEPTGNLDSKMSSEILSLLQQLNREQQVTIILVTHDTNVAQQANKIFHVHDGTIKNITAIKQQPTFAPTLSSTATKSVKSPKSILAMAKLTTRLLPMSWHNILRNKTRSILTMIGIIIGIAAILAMITLGVFTKQKILDSYSSLGVNTIEIYGYPNWALQATDIVPVMFTYFNLQNDLLPLKNVFPAIASISPTLHGGFGMQVTYGGKNIPANIHIIGVDKDYLRISDRKLKLGHNFYLHNIDYADSVCIIGSSITERLFLHQNPLNSIIQISDKDRAFGCTVIGVLEKSSTKQESMMAKNLEIILPYTYFQSVIGHFWEKEIHDFLIKVRSIQDITPVSRGIKNYFTAKYGTSGVFAANPDTLLVAQMYKFLNLFTLLLAIISLLSLVVGGIGIANMMLASISERLKEIGLRKAVGATDHSMRLQFLLEAVIICCCAGLIGLLVGFVTYETTLYVASKFIKNLEFAWIISWPAIALSIISMIVVGISSGIVPAIKAEAIDIISAMRSE